MTNYFPNLEKAWRW